MFSFKNTAVIAGMSALFIGGPAMANGIINNVGRYDGGRLNVQTQRGTNCSSTAPDRPSVSAVAGTQSMDYRNSNDFFRGSDSQEFVGGVAVTIPFGGPSFGDCSALLEIEEARARLDMATTLFEAGAMTRDELRAVAEETKEVLRMKATEE